MNKQGRFACLLLSNLKCDFAERYFKATARQFLNETPIKTYCCFSFYPAPLSFAKKTPNQHPQIIKLGMVAYKRAKRAFRICFFSKNNYRQHQICSPAKNQFLFLDFGLSIKRIRYTSAKNKRVQTKQQPL